MTDDNFSGSSLFAQIAKSDFENALRKGFWRSVFSWLTQSRNTLLPFDEVQKRLPFRAQHYIGLRQIPMENIVGSVGRYQDFDRAFLPRQTHTKSRWISIDEAQLRDIILPPIEVYKIGEVYFVKDGNHRVSVARERGQAFIDAYVIEIDASLPIDKYTNIDDIIRQQEYIEFIRQTEIDRLRPEAKIELSLPGQYTALLDHISVHRWFLGEQMQRPIPENEAVTRWYDEVYLPLVKVIHDQGILKGFPGRSEADLYLWIIEHLWYLREEWQEEVSLEQAAAHFAEEFATNPLRRLINIIKGADPETPG